MPSNSIPIKFSEKGIDNLLGSVSLTICDVQSIFYRFIALIIMLKNIVATMVTIPKENNPPVSVL